MKILAVILAAMGLLALSYSAFEFGRARRFQATEVRNFAEPRPPETASAKPEFTLDPPPVAGSPVAVLSIPRLEMSAVVVEGAENQELNIGPGHVRGTPMPGRGGNFAVAGHRDTFFRPLRQIRRDDTIIMKTRDREFHYRVVSTEIVKPSDIHVLYPKGHETLTLVTCYPFDFVGAAPYRFIVHADGS